MYIKKDGGSHDKELKLVIYDFPCNIEVDYILIENDLQKRRPSKTFDTPRVEEDNYKIMCGVKNGITTGDPIEVIVYNYKVQPKNYKNIQKIFRPSHADYTWYKKYNEFIPSGGGPLSARLTVLDVIAGAFAKMLINKYSSKILFNTWVYSIGQFVQEKYVNSLSEQFVDVLNKTRKYGDSIGGKVRCVVKNNFIGLGDPYEKFDALLAYELFSIPAVKAVEIGRGVEASKMLGSDHNDPYMLDNNTRKIVPSKNDAGGILGGITTGEDLVVTVTFKPIPSISKVQKTVDIDGKEVELKIAGSHDVCAAIRGTVVVEAKIALVIAHFLLKK
ncbi:MAG: chorismate synthase [Bacteroidales bacterium]|jgi:chorismate synthase